MKLLITFFMGIILLLHSESITSQERYGQQLCQSPSFECRVIQSNETWDSLFPNPEVKDIVRRVNRMNIPLRAGMMIAIPKHVENLTIYDVSPFPRYITPYAEKVIFIDQQLLAWVAYNEEGELVWWGPISSGSGLCPNLDGHCETPSGAFRIIRKQDIECISTAFPQRADGMSGGAEMPYCMHFFRGFALHGSDTVPGYRASHGCVRMFIEDARWLNEEFIDLPGGAMKGTRVLVNAPVGR
jgi:hypothetical protein